MSKHSHLILIISISSLFSSLVPAQERVQETRLLAKIQKYEEFGPKPSGSLGSKLFVYTRFDPDQDGSNLFRIEANKEVPVFSSPSAGTGGYIHSIQVSKDDSRIVFVKSGMSHHHRTVIYSVRPDGTQLTELVGSGDDCKGFKPIPPYYGSPHCSVPRFPRLSPEGKRLLFINEVREWDEESQTNPTRLYLSIVPVTGAPIVRLEEVGNSYNAVWSEDGSSIYYHSSKVPDPRCCTIPITSRISGFVCDYY